MTDFTPTPEAVEAVANAVHDKHWPSQHNEGAPCSLCTQYALTAIAAFVEAEGLTLERSDEWATTRGNTLEIQTIEKGIAKQRPVGPWRKRD